MLLDLQDAFAAHELELEKLESVHKSNVDKAKLNELVASVKGVMLGITFRDQTYGRLKIDFGQDAALIESTQKYYTSVAHLLENLRAQKSDWKTMGQLAQWFENYGRHVDQLPTLGVDKEMLQYGAYISSQLHNASMGLKGVTIQKRVDEVDATNQTKKTWR